MLKQSKTNQFKEQQSKGGKEVDLDCATASPKNKLQTKFFSEDCFVIYSAEHTHRICHVYSQGDSLFEKRGSTQVV